MQKMLKGIGSGLADSGGRFFYSLVVSHFLDCSIQLCLLGLPGYKHIDLQQLMITDRLNVPYRKCIGSNIARYKLLKPWKSVTQHLENVYYQSQAWISHLLHQC